MQIRPSPHIAHIVRHYLVLDGPLAGEAIHRLFADGNTGIVFNLAETGIRLPGKSLQTQRCWLYGQLSAYQDFSLSGSIRWIVIVLHPYGAHHLWNIPATEWKDRFFPAQEILGDAAEAISHELAAIPSIEACIHRLNEWIFHLSGNGRPPEPVLLQPSSRSMLMKAPCPYIVCSNSCISVNVCWKGNSSSISMCRPSNIQASCA